MHTPCVCTVDPCTICIHDLASVAVLMCTVDPCTICIHDLASVAVLMCTVDPCTICIHDLASVAVLMCTVFVLLYMPVLDWHYDWGNNSVSLSVMIVECQLQLPLSNDKTT